MQSSEQSEIFLNKDSSGQALLEFTLVLPLLLTLVAGIINFGSIMGEVERMNEALRQGGAFGHNYEEDPVYSAMNCADYLTTVERATNTYIAFFHANDSGRWENPVARVYDNDWSTAHSPLNLQFIEVSAKTTNSANCTFCWDKILEHFDVHLKVSMPMQRKKCS